MKTIIFEKVKKGPEGLNMYLVYETPAERKFAPQYLFTQQTLEENIKKYHSYDVTIYDEGLT